MSERARRGETGLSDNGKLHLGSRGCGTCGTVMPEAEPGGTGFERASRSVLSLSLVQHALSSPCDKTLASSMTCHAPPLWAVFCVLHHWYV